MAYDSTKYQIVQVSDTDWAIQYTGGPLVGGFPTQRAAVDGATIAASDPTTADTSTFTTTIPVNLDDAMVRAEDARDQYRIFVGNNPTATVEQLDQLAADIAVADAFVSEYQTQLQAARLASNASTSLEDLNTQAQIDNADLQRIAAIANAIEVRLDPTSTPDEIAAADNAAFAAELYYEALVAAAATANTNYASDSTSTTPTSLTGNGSVSVSSFGGQILSSGSTQSAGATQSFDIIPQTTSADAGSITTGVDLYNTTTTANGSSQNSGTTVYNTSVGVTSVANGSEQRVRLSPKSSSMLSGILKPLAAGNGLIFPYTPQITYQGSANYNVLETVHANQDWHIYKNTPSIDLTISGIFTAQNETEAQYMLAAIHFLRVTTKMHFGTADANKGLPPPQVVLDGYGTHMFNGLSVIIKNYSMQLPDTVDYVTVTTDTGTSKVPAMTTIEVAVTVQQTPTKAKSFNWDTFADGSLMQSKGWL